MNDDLNIARFTDGKFLVEYLPPHFKLMQGEYEKFLSILNKIGLKDLKEYMDVHFASFDLPKLKGQMDVIVNTMVISPPKDDTTLEKVAAEILYQFPPEKLWAVLSDNINSEFIAEIDRKYSDKFKALTKKEKNLFSGFNALIIRLLFSYIIHETKDKLTKILLRHILGIYFERLNSLLDKVIVSENLLNHLKSIVLPEWKDVFPQYQFIIEEQRKDKLDYFPYNVETLRSVEDLWLKESFIEKNSEFTNCFKDDRIQVQKTVWKKNKSQCFYWLHLIYKSYSYNGRSLDVIADKLFHFQTKDKRTSKNYERFKKRMSEPAYLVRKPQCDISNFYISLKLPQ